MCVFILCQLQRTNTTNHAIIFFFLGTSCCCLPEKCMQTALSYYFPPSQIFRKLHVLDKNFHYLFIPLFTSKGATPHDAPFNSLSHSDASSFLTEMRRCYTAGDVTSHHQGCPADEYITPCFDRPKFHGK